MMDVAGLTEKIVVIKNIEKLLTFEEVAKKFNLKSSINLVEVYDNSHISGTNSIGAMVAFGNEGFVGWLASKGFSSASLIAPLLAWGEILSGLGILLGGLIGTKAVVLGNVVTRLSGGAIGVIMIGAIIIAHSDW